MLLLIILLILIFGGGFGAYRTYGSYGPAYGGGLGLILIIVILFLLLDGGRFNFHY